MKKKRIYHSALQPEILVDKELDFFQKNDNIVFQYDLLAGVPSIYNRCDVIYSEPSWSHGYPIFTQRANQNNSDTSSYSQYIQYIHQIVNFVAASFKPIYLILEKKVHSLFLGAKQPSQIKTLKLNGYPAILMAFNSSIYIGGSINTNYDFLESLSTVPQYKTIGDFSCGYGNTARIFQKAGKNFICSDLNGKCVYYVAKELLGYDAQ